MVILAFVQISLSINCDADWDWMSDTVNGPPYGVILLFHPILFCFRRWTATRHSCLRSARGMKRRSGIKVRLCIRYHQALFFPLVYLLPSCICFPSFQLKPHNKIGKAPYPRSRSESPRQRRKRRRRQTRRLTDSFKVSGLETVLHCEEFLPFLWFRIYGTMDLIVDRLICG